MEAPREFNKEADRVANMVMDDREGYTTWADWVGEEGLGGRQVVVFTDGGVGRHCCFAAVGWDVVEHAKVYWACAGGVLVEDGPFASFPCGGGGYW